jgi:hypothetical protein
MYNKNVQAKNMKKKDFNTRVGVIKNTFKDTRKIECEVGNDIEIDEDIHQGGDIFKTEDGELIDLEFQMRDFDEDELVKYVELAEHLYEKYEKRVTVYIICPGDIDVLVNECEIKSDADFTIKLAMIDEDPCRIILEAIKCKINEGEILDGDDIFALSMLPVMCKKEDRNYFRKEYFRIMNRIT